MSILPHQKIMERCGISSSDKDDKETNSGPIQPCLKGNIRSAGYDLRLGKEYYLQAKRWGSKIQIQQFDTNAQTLIVPPNQVVIVTTLEKLQLPNDLVGHLTLKLDLLLQGLIMANQSQVDAGYGGELFILLYNLSNENVSLRWGQPILRLELAELSEPTTRPYTGTYKNVKLAGAVKSRIESSLHAIRRDVDSSKTKLFWTQIGGTAILVLTSLLTYFGPLTNKTVSLEQKVAGIEKMHDRESAFYGSAKQEELESLRKQVQELKAKMDDLKRRLPPPPKP